MGFFTAWGHIVHNSIEVDRLEKMGMITIDHEQLKELKMSKYCYVHTENPQHL